MPSTMMTFAHRRDHASKTIDKLTRIAILGLTGIAITISPASALPISPGNPIQQQFKQDSPIIEVYERRGGAVRRTTAVGPRGNVARHTGLYTLRSLGASGALSLAAGRRDRRGRCDRFRRRGNRGGLGRCAAGPGLLLVLHRSDADTGILGRLPVTAYVWN
jgi:hypothetical protein